MRTHSLLCTLFLSLTLSAQSPEAFNYQAIARDAIGEAIANSTVGVQFQLHQTTAGGTVVYVETHSTITNDLGLFSLEVGRGTTTLGMFDTIPWPDGPYFLEVGLDPAGGTSYLSLGTQQLLSVPYALHAGSVTCPTVSLSGDTVFYGGGCYLILAGASALNGGCADLDQDGYFDQAGCGSLVDCDDTNGTINPGATEVCDGVDNNCDTQIDESDPSVGQSCNTGLPGICSAGVLVCQGGTLVCQSVNSPSAEVCDGLDNDCDGLVDEGLPTVNYWPDLDNDNYGDAFASPVSTCDGPPAGNWSINNGDCNDQDFTINPDAVEVCDGIDNNCDGQTDESDPNIGQSCNTGLAGICAQGVLVCQNGTLVCQPINAPSAEVCDGLDNDCDGVVDEDFDFNTDPNNCGGCGIVCPSGTCISGLCAQEICFNGIDDDFDGLTDCADPDCDGFTNGPCGSNIGACSQGTITCAGGIQTCLGEVGPVVEVCDGLDNDCDGVVDEDFDFNTDPNNCGGCGIVCPSGTCISGLCAQEICFNGIDDDFDGLTDCADPDCDGFTNGPCGSNIGACSQGTITCAGGIQTCLGEVGPVVEVCDGLDNDCDGVVDEDFDFNTDPNNCGGCGIVCPSGTCISGLCAQEICFNGIDDDFDGLTDCADPDCDGFTNGPCGSNIGACSQGTITCAGGIQTCLGEVGPVVEVCDGLDNDCDGVVDDGNPGAGGSCNTGLAGVCASGTLQCQNGTLVCVPDNSPSTEVCDGLDNDCDGIVDEDFNLLTDVNNCGGCGIVCQLPNATVTCVSGQCMIGSCLSGFADCDGNPATGCEVDINTNASNCGACGNVCPTGFECQGGTCVPIPGCNNSVQDGDESDIDCGGSLCAPCGLDQNCFSNSDCGPGLHCEFGICVPD